MILHCFVVLPIFIIASNIDVFVPSVAFILRQGVERLPNLIQLACDRDVAFRASWPFAPLSFLPKGGPL